MHSSHDNQFQGLSAPTSFADECCATSARLMLYVGTLAFFAIIGLHVWAKLRLDLAADPGERPGFAVASRSRPAFAVSSLDPPEKSESYEIFRHPEGGRRDVFHWGAPGEKPVAELEIYRPGGEFNPLGPQAADLARRIADHDQGELEPAGIIDSKFGSVTLFRRPGRFDAARSCLGFTTRFVDPALQISGWSCQGTGLPARRAAIACMLDRLTLLASGNEPRLADLFASAELKRSGCRAITSASTDWVTVVENPGLRGAL